MLLKSVFLVAIIAAAAAVAAGSFMFFGGPGSGQASMDPAELIISDLRPPYQPSSYELSDGSDRAHLAFGRLNADHRELSWSAGGIEFIAMFGYDKQDAKRLTGYVIVAYVRDPSGESRDIASSVFASLPADGWRSAGPQKASFANASVSTVLWREGEQKKYLSATRTDFNEKESYEMPSGDLVKSVLVIHYTSVYPRNPTYGEIEEQQEGKLLMYTPISEWPDAAKSS